MKQNDLNRAVARRTGETVREISHRGFVPLHDLDREYEPPIDWDEREAERNVDIFPKRKRPPIAD